MSAAERLPERAVDHAPFDCTDTCDHDELVVQGRQIREGDCIVADRPELVGGIVTHRRVNEIGVYLEMDTGELNFVHLDEPVTVLREVR